MPVLEDGDFYLSESRAIMQYLISIFFWENCIKGMLGRGAPDPVELQRGYLLFEEFAGVLDAHLAARRLSRKPCVRPGQV